jgi:hypothetical protein
MRTSLRTGRVLLGALFLGGVGCASGQPLGHHGSGSPNGTTTGSGAPTSGGSDDAGTNGATTEVGGNGGGACNAHDDGLGGAYDYCGPIGTPGDATSYDAAMAMAAATEWAAGSGTPRVTSCTTSKGTCTAVEVIAGGQCARWCFGGDAAGHVWAAKTTTCTCPWPTDPTWN